MRTHWPRCDQCRVRRPRWYARRYWEVFGSPAGYYDFCAQACELLHLTERQAYFLQRRREREATQ